MGAIGDEVVQVAAVVAPEVLLPLPVVVDAVELAGEKAQVIAAQRLQLLICNIVDSHNFSFACQNYEALWLISCTYKT